MSNRYYKEAKNIAASFGLYPVMNQEEYINTGTRMTWVDNKGFLYYLNRRVLKRSSGNNTNQFSIFHINNIHGGYNFRRQMYLRFKVYSFCDSVYQGVNSRFDFVDSDGMLYSITPTMMVNKDVKSEFSEFFTNPYKEYNIKFIISKYDFILSKKSNLSRFDNDVIFFNAKTFFKYKTTLGNLIRNTDSINWTLKNPYALHNVRILAHRKFKLTLVSKKYMGSLNHLIFKDKFGFYYKLTPDLMKRNNLKQSIIFETTGVLGKYNIIKYFCKHQQLFLTRDNNFQENNKFREFVDVYGNTYDLNIYYRISNGKYNHYYNKYERKYRKNISFCEINEKLKQLGYEIINDSYTGVTNKAKIKNIKYGYLYDIEPIKIKAHHPFKFHIYNKYTMHNLNLYFKINNKDVRILTKEYNGYDEKIKMICSDCGCEYKTVFGEAVRAVYPELCPICTRIEQPSFYSINNIKDYNIEGFKTKDSKVYLLNIYDDFVNYYKIGISNSIQDRVTTIKRDINSNNQNIRIKKLIYTKLSLYDAIFLETYLHNYFKDNQYIPEYTFSGYTECFKKITKQQVQSQIDYFLSNKSQIIQQMISDHNNSDNN